MAVEIHDLVNGFASALVKVERRGQALVPGWKGIGSLTEMEVLENILELTRTGHWPGDFKQILSGSGSGKREWDLFIPGLWAVEINLVRMPLDRGQQPGGAAAPEAQFEAGYGIPLYADASNPLGDCLKLTHSKTPERKGVLLFGFTQETTSHSLLTGIKALEVVAQYVLSICLGPRHYARTETLGHSHYHYAEVYGWEIEAACQPAPFMKHLPSIFSLPSSPTKAH